MINPIHHGDSAERIATYKVEPYVVADDVYAVEPHVGRGGWTWYTGSAGWMYRLVVESLLGLRLDGNTLRLSPCIPPHWPGYRLQTGRAPSRASGCHYGVISVVPVTLKTKK